jgi:arylsulfatase A-like enzyme
VRLTRRSLLRRGGAGAATAAGASLLGAAAAPRPARAQLGEDRARNAVLAVLPLVRGDYVEGFEGGSGAETPNLKDLTGDSLRFDRAIAESMPALSTRRALVTGMRAFPFRDWRRTEGMPAVPGFNPVLDHQPLMTEVMRAGGVETAYVTANPVFEGERFPDVRRPSGPPTGTDPAGQGIDEELLSSFKRLSQATASTFRAGIEELRGLGRGGQFFVAVDPFDPRDAYQAPPVYVKPGEVEDEGIGPMDGRLVELRFSDGDVDRVREAYIEHVETVDKWVGELVDAVPDDTVLFVLADHGVALGEHSFLGRAAPTSHRLSYEIPYLIRHPDGEKGGDEVDWYASTHDVAPTLLSFLGLTIPGKMEGEDLTALFDDVDEEDLPDRPKAITAVGTQIVVRDRRWLAVLDREEIERRMYDDDEDVEDDITRFDDIANEDPGKLTELSLAAVTEAGGTLPEFGPDGVIRPNLERGDDDLDDDGIPNDFDAVRNDEQLDGVEPEDLKFDGRDPEDRPKAGAARNGDAAGSTP